MISVSECHSVGSIQKKQLKRPSFKTLEILEGEVDITTTTTTTMIIIIKLIFKTASKGRYYYYFKQKREQRYKEMKSLTCAPLANKSQGQEFNKNC